MFVWLDLETTGLNPLVHQPLELGIILTDHGLKEIARFRSVVWAGPSAQWDPWSRKNLSPELIREAEDLDAPSVNRANPNQLSSVEKRVLEFLDAHGADNTAANGNSYLAGNSIHFDRGFLQVHLPGILTHVSHRMLDVSVFKVLAAIYAPELMPAKTEPAHRVMADLEHSIGEFKHWASTMLRADALKTLTFPWPHHATPLWAAPKAPAADGSDSPPSDPPAVLDSDALAAVAAEMASVEGPPDALTPEEASTAAEVLAAMFTPVGP